jgi:hypothetical protein
VLNLAVQALLGRRGICASAPKDADSLDTDDDVKQEEGHILRSSIGCRGGIVIEVEDDDTDNTVSDDGPSGFDGGPNGDDDGHDDDDGSHDNDVTDDEDCEDGTELKTLPEIRRVTGNALIKLRNGVKKIRYVQFLFYISSYILIRSLVLSFDLSLVIIFIDILYRRVQVLSENFTALTISEQTPSGVRPLLDVRTRWNSTYIMIRRALKCQDAYQKVLTDGGHGGLSLSAVEWARLKSLKSLLSTFNILTDRISASRSYSTISRSIVSYNAALAALETFRNKPSHRTTLPDLCCGADAAYSKLKTYYIQTDKSPIYAIATALHPGLRFEYWTNQNWGRTYEASAQKMVRDYWSTLYNKSHEPSSPPSAPDSEHNLLSIAMQSGPSSTNTIVEHLDEICWDSDVDDVDRANFDLALEGVLGKRTYREEDHDDLERWISLPLVNNMQPLEFWRQYHSQHPVLAVMARDILAVPATSAPSERVFSKARGFIPYHRNRLSPKKIAQQILLESWHNYFGLQIEIEEVS